MKTALAVLLALTPISALADDYQAGYSNQRTCFKTEYREEYVPGTQEDPGYVRSWTDTVEVPCKKANPNVGWTPGYRHRPTPPPSWGGVRGFGKLCIIFCLALPLWECLVCVCCLEVP